MVHQLSEYIVGSMVSNLDSAEELAKRLSKRDQKTYCIGVVIRSVSPDGLWIDKKTTL